MKRKQSTEDGDGSEWTEMELELSQLLLVLDRGTLPGRLPYNWGIRRKRSAIRNSTASSPSSSQTHNKAAAVADVVAPSADAGSITVAKAQASSPATPLSLPATTESDEKPKSSRRKTSLKRKREYYLQIIEDLTKTKAELDQEIENVKRHCDQLKIFNLKLKAREQELSNNGPKSECKIPNLDQSNGSVNTWNYSTAENEEQKQQELQMANHQNQNFGISQIRKGGVGEGVSVFQFPYALSGHPTTSLPMAFCSSISALSRNVESNNKRPLPIPDLNLSIEESAHVDSCQPLDETAANNKHLSKAMAAAQARQRRLQIFRLKKPIGGV